MTAIARTASILCSLALLAGCWGGDPDAGAPPTSEPVPEAGWDADESPDPWELDPDGSADEERGNDGDGWTVEDGDCDDDDPTVYPGASEISNDGIDQNCNGYDTIRCYVDGDADGWGDAFAFWEGNGRGCGAGYSELTGDCEDSQPDAYPGAPEYCDIYDQDCDGDLVEGFPDADGDGVPECQDLDSDNDGDGWTPNDGDCDDNDPSSYPGASEIANDGIDQNCNDHDTVRCYTDNDEDLYGDGVAYFEGAGVPCVAFTAFLSGDCDDGDPDIHPDAGELCDAIDQDCDGDLVEEFVDGNGDGVPECGPPTDEDGDGVTTLDGDCDDADPTIYPGAPETANDGIDQNCNGWDTIRCYTDGDGDGYGGSLAYFEGSGLACSGAVPDGGDCDDADPAFYPDAHDDCDALDQDCDGDLVEDFVDADGDGVPECNIDPDLDGDLDGFTPNEGDCDDDDAGVYPGASEIANDGIDQNCNGFDTVRCYSDDDADDFGDFFAYFQGNGGGCGLEAPQGGDCDDLDAAINPEAHDACDAIDQDCDGDLVEGYADANGDGVPECINDADADGWSVDDGDCDDADPDSYPGAPEYSNDGIDQNCNGFDTIRCYVDGDSDGWGGALSHFEGNGAGCSSGTTADSGDCDDADSALNPNAHDICDAIDQDCDGDLVEDFEDADGDGVPECDDPEADDDGDGFTGNEGDCDDGDADVYPGAPEYSNDGIDQNCNGHDTIRCYADGDGDDWGAALSFFEGNGQGCGAAASPQTGDCNDASSAINPEAHDACDGIDQDCDGDLVEGYADANGDGVPECADDADADGWTVADGDCNDSDPDSYPGAPEVHNDDIDQNCNGADTIACYLDDDFDGYGDGLDYLDANGGGCIGGTSGLDGDCDDAEGLVFPGGHEICDALDSDCDGSIVDEFPDGNGDGVPECPGPDEDADGDGFSLNAGDCDDNAPGSYPGASEISNDGIDQNCNGFDTIRCYLDDDGDSVGAALSYFDGSGQGCNSITAQLTGDCDDSDPTISPISVEVCDAIDQDCDGDLVELFDDLDGNGIPDCAEGP